MALCNYVYDKNAVVVVVVVVIRPALDLSFGIEVKTPRIFWTFYLETEDFFFELSLDFVME